MLKFGLLILLVNILLKFLLGYGLWKMSSEAKKENVKNSGKYNEEPIEEGDPNILRNHNKFDEENNNNED